MFRGLPFTVLMLACALVPGAPAVVAGEIAPATLEHLHAAQVVILGEVHDNPAHHRNQARALAALAPAAIVFEMLTPEEAARVTQGNRADASALAAALGWAASGWPDFAMYHPLFVAAPGARIFGGGLERATVRRAFSEDLADVFGDGARAFGLESALPADEQAAREAAQMAAHCGALPEAMLPGMVAAQRLRDAALARGVLDALDATGGPVALIAGNGHARLRRGVPAVLALVRPGLSVLTLGQLEARPDGPVPFDLWLVTGAPAREDPCAAFASE